MSFPGWGPSLGGSSLRCVWPPPLPSLSPHRWSGGGTSLRPWVGVWGAGGACSGQRVVSGHGDRRHGSVTFERSDLGTPAGVRPPRSGDAPLAVAPGKEAGRSRIGSWTSCCAPSVVWGTAGERPHPKRSCRPLGLQSIPSSMPMGGLITFADGCKVRSQLFLLAHGRGAADQHGIRSGRSGADESVCQNTTLFIRSPGR